MKQLLHAIEKVQGLIDEFQHYVKIADENESDDPLEVILPFGYQYLSKREDIIPDQQALMLVGGYFASKYPGLKEHFISDRQRKAQETIEELLTKQYDGNQSDEQT